MREGTGVSVRLRRDRERVSADLKEPTVEDGKTHTCVAHLDGNVGGACTTLMCALDTTLEAPFPKRKASVFVREELTYSQRGRRQRPEGKKHFLKSWQLPGKVQRSRMKTPPPLAA